LIPGFQAKQHFEKKHPEVVKEMKGDWNDIKEKYIQELEVREEDAPESDAEDIVEEIPSEQEEYELHDEPLKEAVPTPPVHATPQVVVKNIPQAVPPRPADEHDVYGPKPESTVNYQGKEYTSEELIMAVGLDGVYFLMREELIHLMNQLPKKPTKAEMNWVVDHFDQEEHYKKIPAMLYNLLDQYTSITSVYVTDIVNKVFKIPTKYKRIIDIAMNSSPHLFSAPQFPPVPSPYSFDPAQNPYQPFRSPPDVPGAPHQQAPSPWWQPAPPATPPKDGGGALTREEFLKLMADQEKLREEKEERIKLANEIMRLRQENDSLKRGPIMTPELMEVKQKLASMENNQVTELRKELEEIRQTQGQVKGPIDRMEEMANMVMFADKISRRDEVDAMRSEAVGTIDDRTLRLKEIDLERHIKEIEAGSMEKTVDRAADVVSRFGENLGSGIGRSIAGGGMGGGAVPGGAAPGGAQMALLGSQLRGFCPECGTEFVASKNATAIKCENCGVILELAPKIEEIKPPETPKKEEPAPKPPEQYSPPLPETESKPEIAPEPEPIPIAPPPEPEPVVKKTTKKKSAGKKGSKSKGKPKKA